MAMLEGLVAPFTPKPKIKTLPISNPFFFSLFAKFRDVKHAAAAANHLTHYSAPANLKEKLLSLKFPAAAVVAADVLMLGTPLQALAETCEVDNSVIDMNMPLLLVVAVVGATVGGLLARQRKGELQRLNEQLRRINAALRRQAKIESYAPNLSYAPVGARIAEGEVIVDPRKQELISRLKNGKNFLRNQDPEKAHEEFKTALELAQSLGERREEKKACRGLGASLQRQGKYREAVKYHSMVLAISERFGEESGNTEAYGAIADCYTELGDLEKAAKFYDQYIASAGGGSTNGVVKKNYYLRDPAALGCFQVRGFHLSNFQKKE